MTFFSEDFCSVKCENDMKLVAEASAPEWTGADSSTKTDRTNNYFKSADWSCDGTCVITNSADNHVRTFVIPPDLLEQRPDPHQLVAYSQIRSLEPVNALKCYPRFDLQDPATTLLLSAASEHPIRLNSALTGDLVASYPLISPTTEVYIRPHSLLFGINGEIFITGSENSISFFDISRPGQEPYQSFKTGPKNSKASWSNPASSLRGIVSALALDPQYRVLAAGTYSRQIGLYDSGGNGECVGVFSVIGTEADLSIGGGGVTQLEWSSCGRYLYIAERKSDGAMLYDIRKSGQLLSWIEGRKACTNQRMNIDLAQGKSAEQEVWAGGMDGCIRCWRNPQLVEGRVSASQQEALHRGSVNSVNFHQKGSVVVTASGQRHFHSSEDDTDPLRQRINQNSELKIWAIKEEEEKNLPVDV